MKLRLALSALMALTCAAHADILSNGNLDAIAVSSQALATPVGWNATANKTLSGPFTDGMSSEGFANVLAPGGFGLFFKPFQGTTTDRLTASLFQDNPASPGLTYTLTGWAGAGAGYVGLIDQSVKSEFHLQFLNAASTVIGDSTLDLVFNGQHPLGAPNGNPFGYFDYTLSATAPAGTVSVRALAGLVNAYNNPSGGDQAFVIDSFTLSAIPEPSVVSLAILGLAGALAFRSRK